VTLIQSHLFTLFFPNQESHCQQYPLENLRLNLKTKRNDTLTPNLFF
jgi:hypothetical protein